MEKKEIQIANLADELYKANQAYRLGEEIMSDSEYDAKVNELKKLCPNHSFFDVGIHTNISDEKFARERQCRLPIEMRSLDKVKSLEEIDKWLESKGLPLDTELVITPKYDGISILCHENKGKYFTSGDGSVGQDVTEHLSMCKVTNKMSSYINSQLSKFYSIGELIIPKMFWDQNFKDKTNPTSKKPFKAARNTVAGMMNNDTPQLIENFLKYCYYIPYTLAVENTEDNSLSYWTDKTTQLEHLYGESVDQFCPSEIIKNIDITSEYLNELFKQWSNTFVIDGLVLDINDGRTRHKCGFEANSNPAFARAYKNPKWSETAETIITGVRLQISKHGTATPVIEIDPVNISGATISNVNGINAQYIYDWKLGKGQRITILRSGEVIPKIIKVRNTIIPFREDFPSLAVYNQVYKQHLSHFNMGFKINERQNSKYPQFDDERIEEAINENISQLFHKCPYCNKDLIWNKNHIDKKCSNDLCPERIRQQLIFFFETMEVRDMGEKTVGQFMSFGNEIGSSPYWTAKNILNMSIADISQFDGFREGSASKLYRQFQKLERVGYSFAKLSYALGLFEDLGEKTIQTILDGLRIKKFEDLNNLLQCKNLNEQLCQIEGIGGINAEKFVNNLKDSILVLVNENWRVIKYANEETIPVEGPLQGYVFCFSQFRDANLKEKIQSLGGTVLESYTKAVTHLVVVDLSKKTGKVAKAEKDGKVVTTKQSIVSMINDMKQ